MVFGKVEFCYPLNNVIKPVVYVEGETIQQLLDKGNIVLSKDEMIKDSSGSIVDTTDDASEGEYFVVSNAKNGSI